MNLCVGRRSHLGMATSTMPAQAWRRAVGCMGPSLGEPPPSPMPHQATYRAPLPRVPPSFLRSATAPLPPKPEALHPTACFLLGAAFCTFFKALFLFLHGYKEGRTLKLNLVLKCIVGRFLYTYSDID